MRNQSRRGVRRKRICSESLNTAIGALNTPIGDDETKAEAFTAAIDKANRGLSNSLNNVLTVRADLGIKLDELGKLDSG
ncbi:hypothetical protein [Burkholderia pseudomallei]|uniref:hypothetical protein n=1 Tax=Burkholderia pseudomallei TaxID=28450 RepID=UPI0027E0364F|nr:hypothetical protein [Burkholderia pseudomallei]